jgi:protein-L-isoaspartate(D-aspartate) O-methyltransferase
MNMTDFKQARLNMLKQQLHPWGVTDDSVLQLFSSFPREAFVQNLDKSLAYADLRLPLEQGLSAMTPKEQAKILQALKVQKTDRILVLGTREGLTSLLLAKLGYHVDSIDEFEAFNRAAIDIAQSLQIKNIKFMTANLLDYLSQTSSYDIIVFNGSMRQFPANVFEKLNIAGRLFAVIGSQPMMKAIMVTRTSTSEWQQEEIFETCWPRLIVAPEPKRFKL